MNLKEIIRQAYGEELIFQNGRLDGLTRVEERAKECVRQAGLTDEVLDEAVAAAVFVEDTRRVKRAPSLQAALWADDVDFDGVWRLGEGLRVSPRVAVLADVMAKFSQEADNAAKVAVAAAESAKVLAEITPYMADGRTTWPEARERYRKDHR